MSRISPLQIVVVCCGLVALAGDVALRCMTETRSVVPRPAVIGANAPHVQATIYSADWCGPCVSYVKAVREKLPPHGWTVADAASVQAKTAHIVITKTNTRADDIHTYPTTVIRRNGVEVDRWEGVVKPTALAEALNKQLKRP